MKAFVYYVVHFLWFLPFATVAMLVRMAQAGAHLGSEWAHDVMRWMDDR